MKRTLPLLAWLFASTLLFSQNKNLLPIRVAANHRSLETTNGQPFFWLGDTAWELFHRLNREETIEYLDTRKAQGFNVILAVALVPLCRIIAKRTGAVAHPRNDRWHRHTIPLLGGVAIGPCP